ncbi:MAG: sugar ABC transporter permease [Propionibacteriaceae bacterium]|jgi:ABC-type sugar transport system permease subunit|nr:sugar ABC transporter permease [Propionibacteriaceae bacterium]
MTIAVDSPPRVAAGRPRRSDSRARKDRWLSFNLALPSILLLGAIQAYPMVQGVLYSFQKGKVAKPSQGWIGWDNYSKVLSDPSFWSAVKFSVLFAAGGVVLSYLLGLGLALLLVRDIPGRGFLRVGFIVPWVIPTIVGMTALRWMLQDQYGAVNQVLNWFGIDTIYFFNSPTWTAVAAIVAKAWRSFPFMLVSLMATLQSLDDVLQEAAEVDGANAWQRFWHITFPQILPMSSILWVLMTIWSVNDYETTYLLTNNSANARTLMIYSFDNAIYHDLGRGAASAVLTLIVLAVLSYFMLRLQRRAGDQQ